MFHLPYLSRGTLSKFPFPPITQPLLALAVDFAHPPTGTPAPATATDFMKPRAVMALQIIRSESLTEFLLRGLVKDEKGELSLPAKGSVSDEEVREISPLHLLRAGKVVYPPVYQILGTEDECFGVEHVVDFDAALKERGVESPRCDSGWEGPCF